MFFNSVCYDAAIYMQEIKYAVSTHELQQLLQLCPEKGFTPYSQSHVNSNEVTRQSKDKQHNDLLT